MNDRDLAVSIIDRIWKDNAELEQLLAAAEADAKQWRERFMQMARRELRHRYFGDCPDADQPELRDPMCPVCKMMEV